MEMNRAYEAKTELKRRAGSQFEPDIADIFRDIA